MIFHTYRIFPDDLFIRACCKNNIFVFGSNEAGRHGAGAALAAVKYGAEMGRGIGFTGSNTYGIPTKDTRLKTLTLGKINVYVEDFVWEAHKNPSFTFYLTEVGCGLAGYSAKDIAPMFKESPVNCIFSIAWKPFLE